MSCYFLTGGTGAVGSRVLEHLLLEQENRIYLLLRAESEASAEARKLKLLTTIFGNAAPLHINRVVAVRGDTRLPQLGLSSHAYHEIGTLCRRIIHSAGLVRMNLPLDEARGSAVRSAENIISLARVAANHALEKVEFVSTVGVGGRSKEVPEEWVTSNVGFHNTYEQAKAEAEDLVRTSVAEGLPITVHRPSMVVGDTATGRISSFQVFYHLCEFLSGGRSYGFLPSLGAATLDTVPVDYVANAIGWSSGTKQTSGAILHLCSGPDKALSLARLQQDVVCKYRAKGLSTPSTRIIPPRLFRATLQLLSCFADESTRRAIRTAPVFLDYLASAQRFHDARTRAMLALVDLQIPHPDDYLPRVLDYYLDRRNK